MALTREEQEEMARLEAEIAQGGGMDMSRSVMNPNPLTLGERIYNASIDVLPELGGMAGGLLGATLTRTPAGMSGGQVLGQQAIRSMIGAGAGGATGEASKQAIEGTPSAVKFLRSGIEQALYDGVGNLIFSYGGKAFQLTKDQFKSLTNKEAPDNAVRAAQELLLQQKQGASLTPYQATGSAWEGFKESIARGSFTGKSVITRAEQNVQKALDSAKNNILDDISRDVYDGITAGRSFQAAIKDGDIALKQQVDPFYKALEKTAEDKIVVDTSTLKSFAQKELKEIEGLGGFGLDSKSKEIFKKISEIDPKINFYKAHRLLSELKKDLRDAQSALEPSSRVERILNESISTIQNRMDVAGNSLKGTALSFEGRLAQDGTQTLADQYRLYSKFYKEGISDLYSDTTARLLNKDPEKVGETVFQSGSVTAFQDVKRALGKAKELNPKLNVEDTINSIRRGYLETLLKEENLSKVLKSTTSPKVRRTFEEMLTGPQQERVKKLLTAAEKANKIPTSPGSLFFAAQQAQSTATVISLVGLAVSPSGFSTVAENPGWSSLIAGTIILGPRALAKAATDPKATNAILNLVRMKEKNIKLTGPVLLKTIQAFEQAKIQPADLTGETEKQGLTREEQAELERLEAELGQ
jgi:ABC-type dipeptide/oligopeptide/nickel transport system ATPase subunit